MKRVRLSLKRKPAGAGEGEDAVVEGDGDVASPAAPRGPDPSSDSDGVEDVTPIAPVRTVHGTPGTVARSASKSPAVGDSDKPNTLRRYFSASPAVRAPPAASPAATPVRTSPSPPPLPSPWHVRADAASAALSAQAVIAAAHASPMSAYGFHVHHVVRNVVFDRPDCACLFTGEEVGVCASLTAASPAALGLFGRLLSRKGHGACVSVCACVCVLVCVLECCLRVR